MATQRPVEEGYFTIHSEADGGPRLIGSFSPKADAYFYPCRRICPISFGPVEDRELSPVGTLYSWTYVYGQDGTEAGGYGVGQVDLPEGIRVQGMLRGDIGDWEIGNMVRVALAVVAKDDDGAELVTYCFEPSFGEAT